MNAIGRACSWLQEQGYVRPARDLALMHEDLVARGMARHFGAPFEVDRAMESVDDVAKVVRRVHELMGEAPAE